MWKCKCNRERDYLTLFLQVQDVIVKSDRLTITYPVSCPHFFSPRTIGVQSILSLICVLCFNKGGLGDTGTVDSKIHEHRCKQNL